jgi:integrase
MAKGAGSIYRRGNIFWVQIYIDGKPINQSSKSTKRSVAVDLRNKLLGKKVRGELASGAVNTILIGELLDDVLKSDIQESTRYVWKLVVEANLRPFFGKLKASRLSTDHMEAYREKRKGDGRSDATVNRELSILRTAFHNARKRTPPKVVNVPYFPMVKETTIRKGFLSDEQYVALRDNLPEELKALFVCAYLTGIRKGELLALRWRQVDFETLLITLDRDETKGNEARSAPIIRGDMLSLLKAARVGKPDAEFVFNRNGKKIKNFRIAWDVACKAARVPDLKFHDLRRTAVRNMRRAGIPQVIRMKISGHKTDSMERRYNIADLEDMANARELLEKRCSGFVAVSRKTAKDNDTRAVKKKAT